MAEFPPKKILVACDLSAAARRAWLHALALGRKLGAAVEGVHVFEWAPPEGALAPMLSVQARAELHEDLEALLPGGGRIHVAEGVLVPSILATAARTRADLLVLGTECREGLRRLARPSVAEAVLRRSRVPVLLFQKEVAARGVRSVLAPVNLQTYSLPGLRYAAETARALGAGLTVLTAAPAGAPRGPQLRRLEAALDLLPPDLRAAVRPSVKLAAGDPIACIARESARHDLVVLVERRKGVISDAVVGTTAERLLRRSRAPLLAVPSVPA